jgi:hypothetical protein
MSRCVTCGFDLGFLASEKECEACRKKRELTGKTGHDFSSYQTHFGRDVNKNNIQNATSKFFQNDEQLIGAFTSTGTGLDLLNQYIIISNIRVLFWKRGILDTENISFNLDEISSVQEDKRSALLSLGFPQSQIILNIHGAKETLPSMSSEDVTIAVKLIREQMQKIKAKNQPSPTINESIPEKIKKLAELRDAGILTEQEFTNKKTELLKRM